MKYNSFRKQRLGIIDENGNILKQFDSASDACRYVDKPTKEASHILAKCDKINKNGRRAKYYGYYWTKL